jgi:uncharacterized protein YndB with AHSA1/START domain
MALIEGEILIERPVEEVFDFVADERNEPRYNRRMSAAELLTPEPIGTGSRFHAEMETMRRTVDMTVEFTRFDRPRLLALTSQSVTRGGRGRPMVVGGSLTFDPVAKGTRMRWAWQVETPGPMKLLRPIIVWMGRRQERRIWSALKRLLEERGMDALGGLCSSRAARAEESA